MLRAFRRLLPIALLLAAAVPAAPAAAAPMSVGIYPGGGAGTVGPAGQLVPENAELRNRTLVRLAAGRPLALHLYAQYTGAPSDLQDARAIISGYPPVGPLELVVRYRPAHAGAGPAAYARFITALTRELGPRLAWLQVANEANLPGQPAASDGAYPGASRALVAGVLAADRTARRQRLRLAVGFNWAPCGTLCDRRFFAGLRKLGGRRLAAATDWVGADLYPGTWSGPAAATVARTPRVAAAAMTAQLRYLRRVLLPAAGLGGRVRLHISENGFPTGPGRSPATQARALRVMFAAVRAQRQLLGIGAYRWFDLRDQNSASGRFEDAYGLTDDAYRPKPAFFSLRALIARHAR